MKVMSTTTTICLREKGKHWKMVADCQVQYAESRSRMILLPRETLGRVETWEAVGIHLGWSADTTRLLQPGMG